MLAVAASLQPWHLLPALGAAVGAATALVLDARVKSKKPALYLSPTEFNKAVLAKCTTLHKDYKCTPGLTNGHVETIAIAKLRRSPNLVYKREILRTEDGGAIAIDWEHFDLEEHDLPPDAPVLILFPGLTGGSGDSYVQHAVQAARAIGIRAAVFNSRGTADSPVLTPQFYSASFTGDARAVVAHVAAAYPESTLYAAGWSLGANILVNYLGEQGEDTPLEAAVSMCNPFELTISNKGLKSGFSQIYDWNLAASLKRIFAKHALLWRGVGPPFQPNLVPGCKTIEDFDEYITIHSFGWPSVDAYYAGSSSAKRIPAVSIPLLCLQALDDPIAPKEAIPYEALANNPNCMLATTPCGGHLGWASGPGAPFGAPWSDAAMMEWLAAAHDELQKGGGPKGRRGRVLQGAAAGAGAAGRAEVGVEVSARSSAGNGGGGLARILADASSAGAAAAAGRGREEGEGVAAAAGAQAGSPRFAVEALPASTNGSSSSREQGRRSSGLAVDGELEAELAVAVESAVQAAVQAVLLARRAKTAQQDAGQPATQQHQAGTAAAVAVALECSEGPAQAVADPKTEHKDPGARPQSQLAQAPLPQQQEHGLVRGGQNAGPPAPGPVAAAAAVFGAQLRWAL